ncbi:MAG: tetratricopeptide repeat protein, partial [Actinomycetota bacterium]|nr:tetratricopeptide repeat protein [Actinomycetota bacterium]
MARENKSLKRMPAHEFVRRLKTHAHESDRHYTFWLGAGCSVTSGIPAAATLVGDQWLPRLHGFKNQQDLSVEEWARLNFPAYDPENLAALYGPVMDVLFPLKEDRQRETERLCEKGVPGFGYAILAALMSRPDGAFSAAVTTNFDDLIADSMYVYGAKRPLVIQHEALSGFVRPGRVRRPLVVKVHGDHRLNPMHTTVETAELEKGIRRGIQGLLHDRGVIFIGYAGNDRGVLQALEGLSPEAIPLGVWWVSRREPTTAIRKWLEARNATWIQVEGFDELMLLFREEFEIAHPTAQKFERMIERYRETYEHLGIRVEDLPETAPNSEALKEAARNARDTAEDWWKVDLEARRFLNNDPDRAERIYQEGVERLEDSRLLGNYAVFLDTIRKDHKRAEEYYKRALALDPDNASVLNNYALLLTRTRRDPDRAEKYYKHALTLNPDNPNPLGNYALFLDTVRRDPDRAEEYYKRALEIDSEHANNLGSYAVFLKRVRKDPDRAEEYYKRALEIDSEHANNLGNYALLLDDVRRDPDRAEEYYKRALDAEPKHANNLGNYALLLYDVRRDPDRAEEYYKRALEIDSEHANN